MICPAPALPDICQFWYTAPTLLRPVKSIPQLGAITLLGAAPAGFAQQCTRCDNFSLPDKSLASRLEKSRVKIGKVNIW